MKKIFKTIFTDTYKQLQEEQFQYISQQKNRPKKIVIITLIVCISLTIIEYLGKNEGYYFILHFLKVIGLDEFSGSLKYFIEHKTNQQLFSLGYWVFIIILFYFLIPAVIIKAAFREKLTDYGIGLGNIIKEYRIYLLFIVIMLPLVLLFSATDGFQARYPFYRMEYSESLWPNFFIWQVLYFFQFISLEFFFRGFMVHGLKKYFGYYTVFVMTIPYCMIHFGKPFMETLAAIIAGIVLGTLSLKSRSIWMGVFIHYVVALSMDLSALWQKGYWSQL